MQLSPCAVYYFFKNVKFFVSLQGTKKTPVVGEGDVVIEICERSTFQQYLINFLLPYLCN
jgi:hypothetical protein